jgi:hypothetical protein
MLKDDDKLKYYKKQAIIDNLIKQKVKKRQYVVYGARALNAYFPPYLDRHTEDWDIYSPNPRISANRLEKKLDNHFGGDFFYVKRAEHPGTYKVKSRVTERGVADYTKPENKIPHKTIGGIKYIGLNYVKKHIKKTLQDPSAKFRWDKDKEALQRIKLYEKIKK